LRRHLIASIAVAAAITGALAQPAAPPNDLAGAIDIHVHSAPDNVARSLDGLEAARLARAAGMRAIVLKNHYEPTAGLAFLARKQAPGLEVFGGIDLNLSVGGMNVAAIDYMVKVTGGYGRIVWMSTFDAENQVRFSKETRPFVRVSRGGALLPETRAVIAAIAQHRLVLATGHVSAAEALLLLREARRQRVEQMVVTHAINPPIEMSVAQMQEAARLGAFVEFVGSTMKSADAPARVDRFAAAIRQVGPAFCILSSDLGQAANPVPTEGFAEFIGAMRARGFSDGDLARMTKENPARLLGLANEGAVADSRAR
jgi:uncharacterized protein DUF6282